MTGSESEGQILPNWTQTGGRKPPKLERSGHRCHPGAQGWAMGSCLARCSSSPQPPQPPGAKQEQRGAGGAEKEGVRLGSSSASSAGGARGDAAGWSLQTTGRRMVLPPSSCCQTGKAPGQRASWPGLPSSCQKGIYFFCFGAGELKG